MEIRNDLCFLRLTLVEEWRIISCKARTKNVVTWLPKELLLRNAYLSENKGSPPLKIADSDPAGQMKEWNNWSA